MVGDGFRIDLPLPAIDYNSLYVPSSSGRPPLVRFNLRSVPCDPEEAYQLILSRTQGNGTGFNTVTRNRESILTEWENFISLIHAPTRDVYQKDTSYDS
jgi:hypothetical protein